MADGEAEQSTAVPEVSALWRAIHGRVHQAMADGLIPLAVELGWAQIGLLYRQAADGEPDAERPRTALGLPIVPVAEPDFLGLRTTDRRGWR